MVCHFCNGCEELAFAKPSRANSIRKVSRAMGGDNASDFNAAHLPDCPCVEICHKTCTYDPEPENSHTILQTKSFCVKSSVALGFHPGANE
jgi:hypothetical protein